MGKPFIDPNGQTSHKTKPNQERKSYKHHPHPDNILCLIIKKWFDLVEITMMQHGTAYDNVYNFDETGYARIIAMQK